jgi:hypothetical protein
MKHVLIKKTDELPFLLQEERASQLFNRWSELCIKPQFENLATGTYTGYVKDLSGCISTNNGLIINSDSKLLPPSVATSHVTCFGGNNGGFNINTSNSTPNGGIQYSIDGGLNYGSTAQIQGLSAGTTRLLSKIMFVQQQPLALLLSLVK